MYKCTEKCPFGKEYICCCECNEKCEVRCVEEGKEGIVKYGDKPDDCFGLMRIDENEK